MVDKYIKFDSRIVQEKTNRPDYAPLFLIFCNQPLCIHK